MEEQSAGRDEGRRPNTVVPVNSERHEVPGGGVDGAPEQGPRVPHPALELAEPPAAVRLLPTADGLQHEQEHRTPQVYRALDQRNRSSDVRRQFLWKHIKIEKKNKKKGFLTDDAAAKFWASC